MKIALCVSAGSEEKVKIVQKTVDRAIGYVDEIIVVFEEKVNKQIIKWCEKKKYNYIQYNEKSKKSGDKFTELLGLKGIEFVIWLDAGDEEVEVEKTIIENIRGASFVPRVWGKKEICYYANFGAPSVEDWSPLRMGSGLGGSETAVVMLSEEWTKLGYQVTVYGDPRNKRGVYAGVRYLPWYEFNAHDYFNIFIQWRSVRLAKMAAHIKSRQYYLDMHDIFHEDQLSPAVHNLDGIMVKSEYHRSLAPEIPDSKFYIIGNGV